MSYGVWSLVIFLTFGALFLGVGWLMEHADAKYERVKLLAELDQAIANVQLPRAGYLPGPQYAEPPMPPIPWDLAGAAYALGQQRAMQDEVSREVDAMIAEYDAKRGEG